MTTQGCRVRAKSPQYSRSLAHTSIVVCAPQAKKNWNHEIVRRCNKHTARLWRRWRRQRLMRFSLTCARSLARARLPQPEQHSTLIFITNTIWHDSKIQATQQHLWIRFWLGLSFVCPYIFAAQLVLFDSYCFFSLLFLHRHRAKERERDFGMIQTNTHNYPILVLQKSVCCAIEWVFSLASSLYGCCCCCFFLWLLPSLNTKCER